MGWWTFDKIPRICMQLYITMTILIIIFKNNISDFAFRIFRVMREVQNRIFSNKDFKQNMPRSYYFYGYLKSTSFKWDSSLNFRLGQCKFFESFEVNNQKNHHFQKCLKNGGLLFRSTDIKMMQYEYSLFRPYQTLSTKTICCI